MAELIDRADIHHALVVELLRCIRDNSVDKGEMSERVIDCVDAAPAADVVPVRHGEWEYEDGVWQCSQCGERNPYGTCYDTYEFAAYCPCCGTRMDEED